MAVTVSKAGPYYSSGAISFSSLRSNFRAQVRKETSGGSETFNTDTASISASQLLRNTETNNTNPIVPDATENSNIASYNYPNGYSSIDKSALSGKNLSIEDFRNSIKYYYVTLPSADTETNFDIDDQSWNTNLNRNVVKVAFIDGTCGSSSASSPAASFDATAHNLTIDVTGNILGAGGRGGGQTGAPLINGEAGGDALSISSSSGNNIVVLVRSGSKIYGGGGGGEKGVTGANGSGGKCSNTSTQQGCGGAPGCPSGYSQTGTGSGSCCQSYSYCCGLFNCGCTACSQYTQYRYCKQEYNTNGGDGGAGGNGGKGRGYDNPINQVLGIDVSLLGGAGSAGSASPDDPACGATSGETGGTGGAGGDWATAGGNTDAIGNGGAAGKAITGSNYSVTGTITSSVSGLYNP